MDETYRKRILEALARQESVKAPEVESKETHPTESSAYKDRIKAILAQKEKTPELSLGEKALDILSGIGRGALSAIPASGALDVGRSINPEHWKKQKEDVQEIDEYLNAPAKTTAGRIGHNATNWAVGAAPFMGGASTLRAAAKGVGKSGSLGALAGAYKETGMNPVVADLMAMASPYAISKAPQAVSSVGKGIAFPFSKKVREKVRTASAEKQLASILASELGENPTAVINLPEYLSKLHAGEDKVDIGRILRGRTKSAVEEAEKFREHKTAPKFKEATSSTEPFAISETEEFLKQAKHENIGTRERTYKRKISDIENKNSHENLTVADMEKIAPNATKEEQQSLLNFIGEKGLELLPIQAQKKLEALNDEIAAAIHSKQFSEARDLMKEKEALLKDVKNNAPKLIEARNEYAELSKPISDITEHDILGKFVSKKKNGQYELMLSDIPDVVMDKVIQTPEYSSDLLKFAYDNLSSAQLTKLRNYIEGKVAFMIKNSEGNIKKETLHNFIHENPGAFILNPGLKKKLSNIFSANSFINKIEKKFRTSSFDDLQKDYPLSLIERMYHKFPLVGPIFKKITKINPVDKMNIREKVLKNVVNDPAYAQKIRQAGNIPPLYERITPGTYSALPSLLKNIGRKPLG